MLILLGALPFVSTALGGFAALRLQHRLHPVMAFAAGILVATALVDLLPEATELVGEAGTPILVGGAAVLGYLLFTALDALVHAQAYEHQHPPLQDPRVPHVHDAPPVRRGTLMGLVGPLGLIVHSTLDGFAIGVGFTAGFELGLIVALAVLTHAFADGLNVVTLVLADGRGRGAALGLLMLDAVAPLVGVLLSTQVTVDSVPLGFLLAGVAGVFVAIGAGHLLPEAQHRRPGASPPLIIPTALGAVLVVVIRSAVPI